ncbi:MAG: RNA 3'-terminal phosphate cyclase [Verrucomicrobia bacterium]|nr:RNA 3'-terminal phosphate cyclase [Verrucomicrobiota bacterium]
MIIIDGAQGEGGGQILRSALALSLVTQMPFRLENIRAGRRKPGLLRQHLTAVEAATRVGAAKTTGAELGSMTLEFHPNGVTPGDYRFAVGTAGSATLVFQTILPPLLIAQAPSSLVLEGGTHNPFAPPFEFLARSFTPLIERMGPRIELKLYQPGFFPAGRGRFAARIEPVRQLKCMDLLERGLVRQQRARVLSAMLPPSIGERELAVVQTRLGWGKECCLAESPVNPAGPGNALLLEIEADHVTGVFSSFGERSRSAEDVATQACQDASVWLDAGVPVDEHLADQLMIPMALSGGECSYRTVEPSLHSRTNAEIIQRFLPVRFRFEQESDHAWRVTVGVK